MEPGFSHARDGRDVGQDDSGPINFEHVVRARARRVGHEVDRYRDGRRAADDGDENRLYPRRSAAIRRKLSLLPRAEFRRHGDDLYEGYELRGAGQFFSYTL